MHDIRAIRDNPDAFDAALARRGLAPQSSAILAVDAARRERISAASKEVGAAKARGDKAEFERLRALVAEKKDEIARLEDEAKAEDARLTALFRLSGTTTSGTPPRKRKARTWAPTESARPCIHVASA